MGWLFTFSLGKVPVRVPLVVGVLGLPSSSRSDNHSECRTGN